MSSRTPAKLHTQSQFTQSHHAHAHAHQTQSSLHHFLGRGSQPQSALAALEAGREHVQNGRLETWLCQWGGSSRAAGWAIYPGFGNTSRTQRDASAEDDDPASMGVPFVTYVLDKIAAEAFEKQPPFPERMFEYYTGVQPLRLFVVVNAGRLSINSDKSSLSVAWFKQRCKLVWTATRRSLPKNYKCRGSNCHYSFRPASVKLDILDHLPPTLSSAILLDLDTYCVRDCVSELNQEMERLGGGQFLLAGRSGVRQPIQRLADHVTHPTFPRGEGAKYGGLQSGVLGFNLARQLEPNRRLRISWSQTGAPASAGAWVCTGDDAPLPLISQVKMRLWAAQFCPRAPWWHCVVASRPAGYDWGFADQLVYQQLLELKPWVWRQLPCGMHADTQVGPGGRA